MALTSALPTLYEYYTGGGITSGLSADQPQFTLNNKNITIHSGAMHYFRIPKKYWRDRLRKLRAAGLNAVETYVPWNLHEPQEGKFDFGKGGSDMEDFLDVQEYLRMAQEEDLFAIVRPGPYICSEWEFGGLPSWLLADKDVRVRTSESKFMKFVTRYFNALLPLLTMLQFMNGGPIIAFQVENEYGYSPQIDLDYVRQLIDIMKSNGIVELLVSSDGASSGTSGTVPELLFQTVNFGNNPQGNLDRLREIQPNRPVMAMEFWSGWFDHWSENHHVTSTSDFSDMLSTILDYPASLSFYMFHGGTNWGFLNGANVGAVGNMNFEPVTTSYDYDAPLSEAGDYTEKYEIITKLIAEHNKVLTATPERPKLVPRVKYENVAIVQTISLEDLTRQVTHVVKSKTPIPMERLPTNNGSGQSYGYIVYRAENLDLKANSSITILDYVYDTVVVLVNGIPITKPLSTGRDLNGFGYWKQENPSIVLTSTEIIGATLDLVVENWGRGNVGYIYEQLKGLRNEVLLNNQKITDWIIVPLEFKKEWNTGLSGWKEVDDRLPTGPALYRGTLILDEEPADTFIDLQNWTKGVVIVNGFVLGKYAKIGPQQTLYLPGPLLKPGENEILVFEQFVAASQIQFSVDPIFETLFTPLHLLQKHPKLRAIIDLTDTNRYYNPEEFTSKGITYKKINVRGQRLPSLGNLREFISTVNGFLASFGEDADALIGVHCTHGLNRTGYLICKYMVSCMKMDPNEAIKNFESARGHPIERENYIEEIRKVRSIKEEPNRGDNPDEKSKDFRLDTRRFDPRTRDRNIGFRSDYRPDSRPNSRPNFRPDNRPNFRPVNRPNFRPPHHPQDIGHRWDFGGGHPESRPRFTNFRQDFRHVNPESGDGFNEYRHFNRRRRF